MVLHAGASGGAVLDCRGRLVGLVTSNARHSKKGVSLPNLNFCLTAQALRPLCQLLLDSHAQPRRRDFERVDITSPLLQSVWALRAETGDLGDRKGGGAQRLQHLLQRGGLLEKSVVMEGSLPRSRL